MDTQSSSSFIIHASQYSTFAWFYVLLIEQIK